jgi:hypothetical protein
MHGAQLKLNPEKCIFGVQKGKVCGCLVSVTGIEANSDKISAIASVIQKRSSEAHMQNSSIKLIHVEAGRMKLIILHCT